LKQNVKSLTFMKKYSKHTNDYIKEIK